MEKVLKIYDTYRREKVTFKPINPPMVGLYVCGPTVYGDPHLGHARPAITFDVLYRYLMFLGYKVRYVRNITDVGHLENDADQGEDKIAKKARLEQLEPMQVVQQYMNAYHEQMHKLNLKNPDIEPRATGHILEQQEMVQDLINNGYAYESDGSVYFDVHKFDKAYGYGKLSGRDIESLMSNTRDLQNQDGKKNQADFAIWKKAGPEHIMQWNSPWGKGFPGWHLECSVMSSKYLGVPFDIHGGGMDLVFPHHECEIAQSVAATQKNPVNYWMHNNMITINGKKMGKSLGNALSLEDFFSGGNKLLDKSFDPMTIRFFVLQAQYRSTLDFSNEALKASEKGFLRMSEAVNQIDHLRVSDTSTVDVIKIRNRCIEALNDDLNTPVTISHLFEAVKIIYDISNGKEKIDKTGIQNLNCLFDDIGNDILGLLFTQEEKKNADDQILNGLMGLILDIRSEARNKKDFDTSDKIRDQLAKININIKDDKNGTSWEMK